jgi:hypothetical protein
VPKSKDMRKSKRKQKKKRRKEEKNRNGPGATIRPRTEASLQPC